jgi:hypothetical protein
VFNVRRREFIALLGGAAFPGVGPQRTALTNASAGERRGKQG